MGKYINIGNAEFESVRKDEYVDKSMLIAYVNKVLGTQRKFLCVTRARRFGKSIAAKMLNAYYDESVNSHALFHDLNIAKDPSYETQHRPSYKIMYSPERVMCTIFVTGSGDKMVEAGDKPVINEVSSDKFGDKVAKSGDKRQVILAYLAQHPNSRNAEIAAELGLSVSQTRDYLNGLVAAGLVEESGANKNRKYSTK